MSGLLQLWIERLQAEYGRAVGARLPEARGCRAARGALLRPIVSGVLLCLLLGFGIARCRAQGQEPGTESPEEAALSKKNEGKKSGPEVVPPPAGISYTTSLDQTAVWVGDHFHYMISVDYTPDYDFESVLGNTTKETVNMDPFQVMDLTKRTAILKNGKRRLYVDITLANFGTGKTSLQIPQCTLYYFRKDRKSTGPENQAAESLTVPGPMIGLRSTLPPNATDIRDAVAVNSWARNRWVLPAAGWFSLVLVMIGLGWEATLFLTRRKSRKGPDRRKAMEAVRARWAGAVPSDFSDSKTIMEFYDHSYQDLKEYLGHYLESPVMGLTSDELQEEMQRLDASPDFSQKAVKVLATCEAMRYARNGVTLNAEAAREVAQNIRELLSLGSQR
jgi:hypothetical protein